MKNIFLIFTSSFSIYFFSLYLSNIFGIDSILLIRDLAQTCNSNILVGFISNLGILLWAFAAAINIFVSNLISSNYLLRKFIFYGGLFSLILCIDDFFLLHDKFGGKIFYGMYSFFIIFLIKKFWKIIIKLGFKFFMIPIFFLGMSVFFDLPVQILFKDSYFLIQLFEEGFKFIGITFWLNFWVKACYFAIEDNKN